MVAERQEVLQAPVIDIPTPKSIQLPFLQLPLLSISQCLQSLLQSLLISSKNPTKQSMLDLIAL